MHTFWVTFYSYKGGVGRSMALVNVAAHLASIGRRVLMIDFDLEAPGLDSFEEFRLMPGREGLVEYVCSYLETNQPAPVKGYVQEVCLEKNLSGKLWLMPSGAKNERYNERRLSIDWAELYDSREGTCFVENFKADVEDTFKPDYVFVDSRTGLTDVGGVCTLHLPDLVVLLFALNEQNLHGIASVIRVLRDSKKLPQLLPVATPVPNLAREKSSLLEARYERAKKLLGLDVKTTLSYTPNLALKELLLIWDGNSIITEQYKQLANTITEADPAGIDFLLQAAKQATERFDPHRASEIVHMLQVEYPDRPETWLRVADISQAMGRPEECENALRKVLSLTPNNYDAFLRLDGFLRGQKRDGDRLDLAELLAQNTAVVNPELVSKVRGIAGELSMRASKWQKALEYYEKALEVQPSGDGNINQLILLFNIGEARRRVDACCHVNEWKRIAKTFERCSAAVSAVSLSSRVNILQAMHIAFACCGNLTRAKSLLEEASRLALQVSRQEQLFSVAVYDYISVADYMKINRTMEEALNRGELWDGMKLTEEEEIKQNPQQ